jgi:hypothetical protein
MKKKNKIILNITKIKKSVIISIKGPNSNAEWILTKKEAEELRDLLNNSI